MELVGIAHVGRRLGPDALDRLRVEPAQLARLDGQPAAQGHRPGAAFADLGVLIEVRERGAVEDLVRQHARLDRVDEVNADRPLFEPANERS